MDSVCVPPRPGHVVMPMKRNFTSHTTICNKLKGVPSVIDSADTQQKMNKEMIKHANCGNSKGSSKYGYIPVYVCSLIFLSFPSPRP